MSVFALALPCLDGMRTFRVEAESLGAAELLAVAAARTAGITLRRPAWAVESVHDGLGIGVVLVGVSP